jgi:hypothetical protein
MKDKEVRKQIDEIIETLEKHNRVLDTNNVSMAIIADSLRVLQNQILIIKDALSCTQNNQN